MRQHFILFFNLLFRRVYLEPLEVAMRLLVLAERDRCDDGGCVQLQGDVLGRVVGVGGPAGRLVGRRTSGTTGRTACRPGCCSAGRRLRSWRS